jgi:hypothetical protein
VARWHIGCRDSEFQSAATAVVLVIQSTTPECHVDNRVYAIVGNWTRVRRYDGGYSAW